MRIAVVGAGFAGAVLARDLARCGDLVTVFDERPHLGGNCYTKRDESTGVMLHEYGPHIFNTNSKEVWDYVNSFSEFSSYTNRVKAVTDDGVFSLPINLMTINQVFGKNLRPSQAREFIDSQGFGGIKDPGNFEEQALKMIGQKLYDLFFYGYTKKQWGVDPKELPASILKRLPIRFNYDDNYYDTKYQGIPVEGYTPIFEKILDCPGIRLELGARFDSSDMDDFHHVFYSGPIDKFFGYSCGRLGYRTIEFERHEFDGDYQGNAVVNYTSEKIPYTRITEHKHFTPQETHEKTVCFTEYSREAGPEDTPYYPIRLVNDRTRLESYKILARDRKRITFIGRLGTYRYLNMDQVIAESLSLARRLNGKSPDLWPTFSIDNDLV